MLAVNTGAAMAGVTVSVVNTTITSGIDAAGRFSLLNVPNGALQLRFNGPGVDATLPLAAVGAPENIEIVVDLTGSSATLESERRSSVGETEVEGRIESLPPTMTAGSFKVSGVTIVTTESTRFEEGSAGRSFSSLAIGMRVHVKGTPAGAAISATVVQIQNTNAALPVEVNGVIDSLSGTATAFQFKIGSRQIKGDTLTDFFGDGDSADSFAHLNNGDRVEVKGQQRDGFIYAARIHINGDSPGSDGGQDSSASIQGTLTALAGVAPSLTLTVGGTTVTTNGGSEVKRRGDVQSLAVLRVGMTLHVIGDRQPNGSIVARMIDIVDDAPGGEFQISGSLGGLKGDCPSISFNVNGYRVATNGSTAFEGGTCASLKSGNAVEVAGTVQADGSVLASRVKKG